MHKTPQRWPERDLLWWLWHCQRLKDGTIVPMFEPLVPFYKQ